MFFATCNTIYAKKYIETKYPNALGLESYEEILKLVSDDIFRVTDPFMHGAVAFVAGKNFVAGEHTKLIPQIKAFVSELIEIKEAK